MQKRPIDIAIEKAGSQSALARAVGVKYQAVQYWARVGHIPFDRLRAVADATGIPLAELRPELFDEGGHA